MINNISILAIIPARGGSKGVKKKNIRKLSNKPLISWSIEEALKSKYIDKIIVTTDDDEIIKVASEYKVEIIKRDESLAQDTTPMIDVILNVLEKFNNYDFIMLLQPTSPLRIVEDIDRAIEMSQAKKYDSLISISESSKHPYWMFYVDEKNVLNPFNKDVGLYTRRQDLPPIYYINGCIYLIKKEILQFNKSFLNENTHGFVTPPERSIDIDFELDFQIAEFFMLKNKEKLGE